jgi:predicted enzyme related to lactoylglutathione lyase
MAFVLDPGGAAVGLWQAGQHIGATLVNEPGAVVWNELVTADPDASVRFYREVVGLTTSTMSMGEGDYTMFQVGDAPVGGTTPPQMPGTPNHWHVYFAVADADATVAKAADLGGEVLVKPFDTPAGVMAVLRDPQGAVFSINKPPAQQ